MNIRRFYMDFAEKHEDLLNELRSLNEEQKAVEGDIARVKSQIEEAMRAEDVKSVKTDFLTIATSRGAGRCPSISRS